MDRRSGGEGMTTPHPHSYTHRTSNEEYRMARGAGVNISGASKLILTRAEMQMLLRHKAVRIGAASEVIVVAEEDVEGIMDDIKERAAEILAEAILEQQE